VQHSHIHQVEASDTALVFPLVFDPGYNEPFDRVVKALFTKHPLYHWLEFTAQHYTIVAEYIMWFLHTP